MSAEEQDEKVQREYDAINHDYPPPITQPITKIATHIEDIQKRANEAISAAQADQRRYRYLIIPHIGSYPEDYNEPSPEEHFLTIEWQGASKNWPGWDAYIDSLVAKSEIDAGKEQEQ